MSSTALRDNIVSSAVRFLSDPKVKAASLAKQISFLETKGLTSEEIQVALNQAKEQEASDQGSIPESSTQSFSDQGAGLALSNTASSSNPNMYNSNRIYHQNAAQAPVPPRPKYDWRDLFIATVVAGGLGYGLYELLKTYIIPMFNGSASNRLEEGQQQLRDSLSENNAQLTNLASTLEKALQSINDTNSTIASTLERIEKVSERLLDESTEREVNAKLLLETVTSLKETATINSFANTTNNGVTTSDIQSELRSLKALLLSKRVPPSATPSTLTSTLLSPTVTSTVGTGLNMSSYSAPTDSATDLNRSISPASQIQSLAPQNQATPIATSSAPLSPSLSQLPSSSTGTATNDQTSSSNDQVPETSSPSIPSWQLK